MTELIDTPLAPRIPSMVGKDRVSFFLNGRFRSYHLKSQQGQQLLELLKAEVQDVERIGELSDIITWIAKQTNGRVTVEEGTDRLRLDGKLIDYGLSGRIASIVEQGVSFESLARFIEKVSENPDPTVAEDLYRFLEKGGLPLTPDGDFMAFKGTDANGWSKHSGTTGKVHYEVGKVVSMPREDCDPNRQRTCSRGLHACSFGYLDYWYRGSDLLFAVKINPTNVTAIPADHDDQKLRCCEMEVMAIIPREDAATHYPKVIDTRYPPVPTYPAWDVSDDGRLAGGAPIDAEGRPQGWIEVGNADGSETAKVWGVIEPQTGEGADEGAEPTGPADAVNDGPLKFTPPDDGAEEDAPVSALEGGKSEGYVNGVKDKANGYPADATVTSPPQNLEGAELADYHTGYAEGYALGYAEPADEANADADGEGRWTLARALHEGKRYGINQADADYPEYHNDLSTRDDMSDDDNADESPRQALETWLVDTLGCAFDRDTDDLLHAFDRAARDAYHTRFNSKQDDAG